MENMGITTFFSEDIGVLPERDKYQPSRLWHASQKSQTAETGPGDREGASGRRKKTTAKKTVVETKTAKTLNVIYFE